MKHSLKLLVKHKHLFFTVIILMVSFSCSKERKLNNRNAQAIYQKYSLMAKSIMNASVDYTLSKVEKNEKLTRSGYSNLLGSSFENTPVAAIYSDQFKNMMTDFVKLIRIPNYFKSNEDIRSFYLDNVSHLLKDSEKEEAARVITLTVELNSKIKEKSTGDRLLWLRLSGSLPQYMSQSFRTFRTMSVVVFIAYEVAAFVVGYFYGSKSFSNCDNFWCQFAVGMFYALGAYAGACLNDWLPWQQDTNNFTPESFCLAAVA